MKNRFNFSIIIIILMLIMSFVAHSEQTIMLPRGIISVDLSMTKDVNDINGDPITAVIVSEVFKYKLSILNSSANDTLAGDVEVQDILPPEVAFFDIPFINPPGWTCNASGSSLSCINDAPLIAGGTQVIEFPVIAQSPGSGVLNTATVIADPAFLFDTDPSNDSDTAFININTVGGELTINKSVSGGIPISGSSGATNEFAVGDTINYEISVTNNSAALSYTDVLIGDPFTPEFSFVSVNATAGFVCNYDMGFHDVICENNQGSPLGPGQTVDVMIQGTAISSGFGIPNIAHVVSLEFGDDLDSNLTLIDVVDPVAALTLLEVSSEAFVDGVPVSSISKGSVFTYRNTIQNVGAEDAIDVSFYDVLPPDVVVNSVNSIGWICELVLAQEYSCLLTAPLSPNSSAFVEFEVMDVSAPEVAELQNTVTGVALNADPQSTISTVNFNQASFNVNVTNVPGLLEPNTAFDIVVDVVNTGTTELMGIEVVNTIPDGFSYIVPTTKASVCSVNGLEMTCNFDAPIAIGVTETITIPVLSIAVVDENETYTNVTAVNSPDLTSPLNINTVLDFVTPQQEFDVSIVKSLDINEILVNNTFEYLLTVTNIGDNPVTGLTVTDNLPVGLQFNSVTAVDWSCSGTTQIVCVKDSLAAGLDSQIILNVTAPSQAGLINNVAQVSINELDSDLGNNNSQVTIDVVTELELDADLSVNVDSNININQGDSFDFEIQTKNSGPDTALRPALNIVLTGIIENISIVEGSDWNCQILTLAINCQFNAEIMDVGQESPLNITVTTSEALMNSEDINVSLGISSATNDSDLSNNSASTLVIVDETPDEGDINNAIGAVIGSSGDSQTATAIENVSGLCGESFVTALDGLCSNLYQAALAGNGSAVRNFIEQITPDEVIGQSTSVSEIASAQFRNIGARLSQLRGGGGSGFSSAGLNARYGNGSIPLGMLAYLNQAEDEANGIDTNNDFISPWGFFVNGSISMGEKDATGRELGFDFDTFGLTAGFDYRLDAKKVIGFALGYANFESSIGDTAELDSTGLTYTGYGSFYITDNLYLDARISYGSPEFKQSRSIDFTLGNRTVQRTAISNTDASQYSVSMSTGYSFYKNAWNITPNASFSYVNTTIDSFTETGAGDLGFVFDKQEIDSLVWSTGIMISKAISMKKGVLTPQFDFNYNYESKNNSQDIVARFVNAPDGQVFIVKTDSPDRSFGSVGLGLVYIAANGKQAYINYRSVLALEDFSRGTINFGMRFEF